MQTFDGIILKKKVRYLDPAAIWEAKHVSPKWMKDDDEHLKSFETKKAKQKERKRFDQETFTNVAAYISLMMSRWEDMDVIFAPYHIQ